MKQFITSTICTHSYTKCIQYRVGRPFGCSFCPVLRYIHIRHMGQVILNDLSVRMINVIRSTTQSYKQRVFQRTWATRSDDLSNFLRLETL